MNELGLVIFKNGTLIRYGNMVYMDQKNYFDSPGHEEGFKKDIMPSFSFKLEEYEYNDDDGFYANIVSLSKQGLIIILNNKEKTTDSDKVLGYLPSTLTMEQQVTLKDIIDSNTFAGFKQNLYEFIDEELIEYRDLEEYYSSKITKAR